jgi:hypothetical protein
MLLAAAARAVTAALSNLADHTDAATTRSTAKIVGYPTSGLGLHGGHRSWRPVLLGLAGLALAVLIGGTPARLAKRGGSPAPVARRRRRRFLPGTSAATATDARTEPDPSVNVGA